ncbi:MAG: hypothetical protein M1834_006158 [Cirrosporium novae-zelandiae]|nr:MAG: hypothetical protein M1834_006158 [Cirrosporium novae-zelandiae]
MVLRALHEKTSWLDACPRRPFGNTFPCPPWSDELGAQSNPNPDRERSATILEEAPNPPQRSREHFAIIYLGDDGILCKKASPSFQQHLDQIFPQDICDFVEQLVHSPHPMTLTSFKDGKRKRSLASLVENQASTAPQLDANGGEGHDLSDCPSPTKKRRHGRCQKPRRTTEEGDGSSGSECEEEGVNDDGAEYDGDATYYSFSIKDDEKRYDYLYKKLESFGQVKVKPLAKAWIKKVHPKKQGSHPYNGGKEKIPKRTQPEWWPERMLHKEPDHSKKPGLRGTEWHRDVESLRQGSEETRSKLGKDTWERLEELYEVLRQEERWRNGEIDGDTIVYVSVHKKSSSRRTKKAPKTAKKGSAKKTSAKQPKASYNASLKEEDALNVIEKVTDQERIKTESSESPGETGMALLSPIEGLHLREDALFRGQVAQAQQPDMFNQQEDADRHQIFTGAEDPHIQCSTDTLPPLQAQYAQYEVINNPQEYHQSIPTMTPTYSIHSNERDLPMEYSREFQPSPHTYPPWQMQSPNGSIGSQHDLISPHTIRPPQDMAHMQHYYRMAHAQGEDFPSVHALVSGLPMDDPLVHQSHFAPNTAGSFRTGSIGHPHQLPEPSCQWPPV